MSKTAVAWVALTACVLARPADAQEADRYFRRGVQALREGDFERAATSFEKAYQLEPRAAALCNLALTYDRWNGHETEALEHYGRCADEDASGRFTAHARAREQALRAWLSERAASASASSTAPPEPVAPPAPRPPLVAPLPRDRPAPPPPLAPPAAAVPTSSPTAAAGEPPSRARPLLWVGIASSLLAGASLAGGLVTIAGVQEDARTLDGRTGGGERPITNDEDAELLRSARNARDFGVALYITSGALAALSAVLILADVTRGEDRTVTVAAGPLPGGAGVTLAAPLD